VSKLAHDFTAVEKGVLDAQCEFSYDAQKVSPMMRRRLLSSTAAWWVANGQGAAIRLRLPVVAA